MAAMPQEGRSRDFIMGNARNKHRNIRKGGHVKTVRYHDLLRAKRTQNPLSGLNPAKVRRLYELYREGKYADVQLAWDALEEYDDMLGTVLNRRQSALGEMEWDMLIDARAVGEDAALQALAEEQQDFITRRLRAVENLSDAIKWLGLANFRRYSALEVLPAGSGERWLPIHHWLLCRPALEGAWCYNENAETSCARVEPIDMSAVILREVARPIDLVAMFLISAKEAAIDGWDSFLEVFGNPALFFKMPPGTSDDQRDEYASIIKEISSDGAGVYPDGGEIHTVETSAANADAFSSRAEWCDKALVRRATGGLLTVLAESGSGTLAGSAHMEAFRQIAANDAISIAECINRQYVRRRLAAQFPGLPVLVYFTLTQPVINDRAATVNMLCQLAGQRWRATDEAVSEEVGVEVHTEEVQSENSAPQVPVMDGIVVNANSDLEDAADGELPLNEEELATLRFLGGGLNPAQVAADAAYVADALREGMEVDPQEESPEKEEELATNAARMFYKRDSHGRFAPTGAVLRKNKGSRSSKGNPQQIRIKSNTPLKAARLAKPQAQVDAAEKAITRTATKGGRVEDAARVGKSSLSIEHGMVGDKSNDFKGGYGSSHQQSKHGGGKEMTTPRKVAQASVLGKKSKDRKNGTVLSDYKGTQAALAVRGDNKNELISAYKRKKPKSGTQAN